VNVPPDFFDQEPLALAQAMVGKVLRHRVEHPEYGRVWLAAKIIETEAYYRDDKGSHSSLGFTEARKAMFMAPGTIYMYYSRGGDSLNFSALGEGAGVEPATTEQIQVPAGGRWRHTQQAGSVAAAGYSERQGRTPALPVRSFRSRSPGNEEPVALSPPNCVNSTVAERSPI